MARLFYLFLIQYMAILPGVLVVFQQGGLVIHIYDVTDTSSKTEQFSDILFFDGLNDCDPAPENQLPEDNSEPEEENTKKDESKLHETYGLGSQLSFSLAPRPGEFQNIFPRSLSLKITTPPPEDLPV